MMKSYIFITNEGFTFQPEDEGAEPDIENSQVLGYAKGTDKNAAFNNLLQENQYLLDTKFNKIICLELKDLNVFKKASYFYLEDFR